MGCGASYVIPFDPVNQAERRTLDIFQGMGFTKYSVDQLYTVYYNIDNDNSNSVDPKEFFRANNVEPLAIYQRFFEIFDLDGSGELNFSEFVMSVWNFLTYDEKTIGQMVFLLCPRAQAMRADTGKMREACKLAAFKSNIKALHGKLDIQNSSWIDLELKRADVRWMDGVCFPDQCGIFAYENQILFSPFMKLRDQFRAAILGKRFWEDMTGFRRDDEILSSYNYPFIVRDKLLEIEMKDLKDSQRKNLISELRSKSKMGKNRSFIMKHFGRHYGENKEKQSRETVNFTHHGHRADAFEKKLSDNKAKGNEILGGARPGFGGGAKAGKKGGSSSKRDTPGKVKMGTAKKIDQYEWDERKKKQK